MKLQLFDFQEEALSELRRKLVNARSRGSSDDPEAISFSAPTGAGKTIVMTALFEQIFNGADDLPPQKDASILWVSDMPELNEQTRRKIESKSDRIRVRQLVVIDSDFDAESLEGGRIYFVNTQKLGTDKLLTRKGDTRQHTIWETFSNTARQSAGRFYVVIDEAHRGMRTGRVAKTAQTIMQRFILGSPEDSLCRMPLVVGISATPKRFEDLLSDTSHTVSKVYVSAEDVRRSGLLKDRILIHHPERDVEAEMALVEEAARRWQGLSRSWCDYCKNEGSPIVRPALVIQVEDGSGNKLTKTDLGATLSCIEKEMGRRLLDGEVAHAFNDSGDLDVDGRIVTKVEASRIEDKTGISVVLFKMSLSTGWDCPRAEVMMSFRRASDHTYIAQLLGRMVRTPLARRILANASLNDVHLFLPHYDRDSVNAVIEDLRTSEDVPPTEAGSASLLVGLKRSEEAQAVFGAMDDLITYRVNATRKQSFRRRYLALARALTHDSIEPNALSSAREKVLSVLDGRLAHLKSTNAFDALAEVYTQVDLKIAAMHQGLAQIGEEDAYKINAAYIDIERHFQNAGRILSNGLHMDYWRANSSRPALEVQVEATVLANDIATLDEVEHAAEREFAVLYKKYKARIGKLKEERRQHYELLCLSSSTPEPIPWRLPDIITFKRSKNAKSYPKHLFVEDNGEFLADLGTWEDGVLAEELRKEEVIAWYRNVDRKPWSLEVPYNRGAGIHPMYPDMVIARKVEGDIVFDILEPHDASRDDNCEKAKGLAHFVNNHPHAYDRVQLIRAINDNRFRRLDMGDQAIRRKVLSILSNDQLDMLFEEAGICE